MKAVGRISGPRERGLPKAAGAVTAAIAADTSAPVACLLDERGGGVAGGWLARGAAASMLKVQVLVSGIVRDGGRPGAARQKIEDAALDEYRGPTPASAIEAKALNSRIRRCSRSHGDRVRLASATARRAGGHRGPGPGRGDRRTLGAGGTDPATRRSRPSVS